MSDLMKRAQRIALNTFLSEYPKAKIGVMYKLIENNHESIGVCERYEDLSASDLIDSIHTLWSDILEEMTEIIKEEQLSNE